MVGETAAKEKNKAQRRFVNDLENTFTMFILFTKADKSLKVLNTFVNAGEQNCSPTFAGVHEGRSLSSRRGGSGVPLIPFGGVNRGVAPAGAEMAKESIGKPERNEIPKNLSHCFKSAETPAATRR